MEFLLPFLLFILGLSIGSFINCVVDRKGIAFGRSYCDHCQKTLTWLDNIPLLSFALLRGKSRCCKKRISLRHPLVEVATGVVFGMGYVVCGIGGTGGIRDIGEILFLIFISSALILIFVFDWQYQIIPDQITFSMVVITIIYRLFPYFPFTSQESLSTSLEATSEVFLVALGAMGFFLFLYLITKGKGMGFGDVKFAFLMGLLLGWPGILVALYFAFLTGAGVGVILILLSKKEFGQHIPFGPFLVGGTFVSLFWGEKILGYLGSLGYLGGI